MAESMMVESWMSSMSRAHDRQTLGLSEANTSGHSNGSPQQMQTRAVTFWGVINSLLLA
jgi:hypothetical protein